MLFIKTVDLWWHTVHFIGMLAGDFDAEHQSLFVVERKAFTDLIGSLVRPCPCAEKACWTLHSWIQACCYI